MKCGQLCPYNTISGCKVNWYNGICPLSNAFAQNERKQTNADRIRAMSDGELAEYFAEIGNDASNGISYSENPEEWLEWLKQPAEEA